MYALQLEKLNKAYPNKLKALTDVDLNVERGDFFGLLGPNGAGKTTMIGIMSSLVKKTGGRVVICGYDIDQNFSQAKSCLGIVPQEFNLAIFETVTQILINQAGYYGISMKTAKPGIEKYLKMLNLWHKRNEIIRNLSGGMKRRVMIARALIHEPEILILDEPTAGVDIELRHATWEFLKQLNQSGKTIILTTHYLEEAEYLCKNIGILQHGRLIAVHSIEDIFNMQGLQNYILNVEPNDIKITKELKKFVTIPDNISLKIKTNDQYDLSTILHKLLNLGYKVRNIKTSRNRLEELFLQLTNENRSGNEI